MINTDDETVRTVGTVRTIADRAIVASSLAVLTRLISNFIRLNCLEEGGESADGLCR